MRSKVSSGNGRRVASPFTARADAVGRGLAGVDHGLEQRRAPRSSSVDGHVAGDDPGAAAEALEGVAAEAAAEVEQQVAGAQAEAVVVDGEHRLSARPSARDRLPLVAGGRAGTARPAGLDVGRLGQQGPVLLDGADRGVAPGPAVDDPLAAGGADARPAARGRRGRRRILAASASLSPGGTQQGGLAVGADDLGQGAAGGGHQGHAAATWPRWPAARSPRRATARRPPRPRSRAR